MRKSAIIVGFREAEVRTYYEQLRSLFQDSVELSTLVVRRSGPDEGGEADRRRRPDLILCSSYEAFVRSGLASAGQVVFAERTISSEGFERLVAASGGPRPYAEGGPLLALVDETEDMARRLVEAILRMGYEGEPPKPAARGDASALAGRVALVLGPGAAPPEGAAGVLDIGEALLDVSTILDIGIRLDLDELFHRHSIRSSYRDAMTANIGLADILGKMNRCEGSLDVVLRLIEAGVVGVDTSGRVSSCNEQAALLLGRTADSIVGEAASELFPRLPFAEVLQTKTPVVDRLERQGGQEIGYSIDPIIHSGSLYGAVAVISPRAGKARKPAKIEARQLSKGYRARYSFDDLVAESSSMRRCRDIAIRAAASSSSILIYGESGTGKEVFAQAIHNASERSAQPFVAINCGALPESLLESELFGYEEGAFTGARKGGKPGLFELAHHGTLFLDEMASMPLSIQMRLLRVLEEREVMRLGGDRVIGVDIRVIAVTNRDPRKLVDEGSLREDLYYRLNVLPIRIPPLRERPEDIMPLVRRFQGQFGSSFELTAEAEELLMAHDWPGNARELRNYVEYLTNLGVDRVRVEDLPSGELGRPRPSQRARTSESKPESRLGPIEEGTGDEENKRLFILELLDEAFEQQRRMGRRSLFSAAKEHKLYMSEQEIRAILKELEREGLVTIRPGKGGTFITPLGREYVARRGSRLR
jgi:Transcriptional regulator containing PAS, AAA-type ATPase, and DNA-binding domains